ncbi:hypothetical protein PF005_g23727 [Phytophthora fragariae]|uniref:PiggyBac transposable element-derived protein domain-containing protein n=1 Tax=Phytophthora fragariae TaxID=53985 RepID=A0A6A3WBG6_9STRA|nr:hypothetical protein PF003_g21353 [Phytophthora fragariae]KAE8925123.1 hypothetical protein PF009_g24660 [Phytophthora fragariae]KAE8978838.1 hypothetical protein PF011_g23082 [Phytophthora fragariae]KAE9077758.1 hypothetical protein PF010_g23386 [Phytophthora fragariae]KAE9100520.1 hypothetical protein PF006_g22879 [Phytophthora fragariae]
MYVDTLVAFSPVKEGFVSQKKKYVGVGNAFLVGRVCRIVKKSLFQINSLDSQFQNHVETLNLSAVQRGNAIYRSIHGNSARLAWGRLCAVDEGEEVNIDAEMELFEQFMEPLEPPVEVPTTVAEVEAIKNMRFEPGLENVPPTDLYQHADGSTKTRLRPEFNHIFQHSSSASLFAYIPVSFWQQVVREMNTYARIHSIALAKLVSLDELMTFLGILFYMALIDKGEYSNYWGLQVEDTIFGGSSVGLDNVMPLRRFKDLRKVFCFQCVDPRAANTDQAARIRPLLNLLKVTGSKYVEVGRDIALDEASVACRSKFGKPLIVYNPMKPTGKYHFRIYMLCCATTWISLNFRLHCVRDIAERLDGVVSPEDIQALNEEIEGSSSIRKCVLEVVRPLYCTRRIVNSDNYYTSVQLLIALRIKGLYGRGTVRKTSSHFPKHVLLEKKDCVRGEFRQGVSIDRTMVAASWFDSAIVAVVSNADASTQTTVSRQVRAEQREFTAPTCIKAYNTNMQGVDRLDQMRARFSLADGHSFKKWHKKLGLALIDVARANAYLTRRLVVDMTRVRDPHREFLVDLISELLSGKWKEAPSERQMFYADAAGGAVAEQASPSSAVWISGESGERRPFGSPQKQCSAVSSKQYYTDMNRKRRGCVVCRWKGRYATQVTDICVLHNVYLCQNVHASSTPYTCPRITWTCWEKYHRWYLPHKLFSLTGKVCTSSRLYKLKQEAMGNPEASGTTAAGRTAVRAIVL